MLFTIYENFTNFQIEVNGEFVSVVGLTAFAPIVDKVERKVKRFENGGETSVNSLSVERRFEVTGEVLGVGEDVGNNFIVSLANSFGESCKTKFKYTQPWDGTIVSGVVHHNVKINGEEAMTFTDTMTVDGKPTITPAAATEG